MPRRSIDLKSGQSTAEIEAGDGTIEIQLPLTLAGWDLASMIGDNGSYPAVVTSADGDHFIGEVTEADDDRYTVTVELS
jgi:hypothetical protein